MFSKNIKIFQVNSQILFTIINQINGLNKIFPEVILLV